MSHTLSHTQVLFPAPPLPPFTVQHNSKLLRFETTVDQEVAFLDYRWYKGGLALMHTFVPTAGRRQGVAAALAHYALEFAKAEQVKIMVYCPYVAKYLQKNPGYKFLIDQRFRR